MILHENAPTAGLSPHWYDLFPRKEKTSFPDLVAQFVGAASTQIECSGTACIFIAFETLKRRSPRRTVIIPAYTCPLVVLAAARAGLKVVACDIEAGSFELDRHHLLRLLGSDTLCVIATHYGGALTDVAGLRQFVAGLSPQTFIVEDAAQAFGATWSGRPVGLAGHIGFYSFAVGKGLTLYEGGALVCEDEELCAQLAETARRFVPPKWYKELWQSLLFATLHFTYNSFCAALTYGLSRRFWLKRGDDIRAIGDHFNHISLHKVSRWRQDRGAGALTRLPAHLAMTRASFSKIATRMSMLPEINVHKPSPSQNPNCTFLFVTLPTVAIAERALDKLWPAPLGVSKLFARAINDYPYLKGKLLPSQTPNARDLAARTLTITTASSLTERDIEIIAVHLSDTTQRGLP